MSDIEISGTFSEPNYMRIREDSRFAPPKWRLWIVPPPFGFGIDLKNAPNWLCRLMQRMVFGFQWERLK